MTAAEGERAEIVIAEPRFFSAVPIDTDIEAAQVGARMLGLPLFPQGRRSAMLLEARDDEGGALYRTVVVQMPRRSTKTTSIWATLIGRAMTRPGYRAVVTAQTGTVASSMVLEHGQLLEQNGYAGFKRKPWDDGEENQGDGTMRLLRNGGRERIEFKNGSRIWCVPPNATAVRGAAADDILIDEGGEFEGQSGEDFINAVLPLMDTRGELAQLIVAGTPGKVREGMFWNLLEQGRKGDDELLGILDYSAADHENPEDPEVWLRVHPGPSSRKPDGSSLTSRRTLERRFKAMPLTQWAREYLCMWPVDAITSAVNMEKWSAAERPVPPKPDRYAWAYDVAPDGSSAAVAAAWRDEDGVAWVEIMAHRPGTGWAEGFIRSKSAKNRQPIWHDSIGANVELGARLEQTRPKVRHVSKHFRQGVVPAQAAFVRELEEDNLRHVGQPALTAALEGASWRNAEGHRLWGRKMSRADISPAVAASLALWAWDEGAGRAKVAAPPPITG